MRMKIIRFCLFLVCNFWIIYINWANDYHFFQMLKKLDCCSPKVLSKRIAALDMFMYTIIDRITSGMISDGGITCNRYWRFSLLISRHCWISPSWPNDALIVGKAKTDVKDLVISDITGLIVVSSTKCGDSLLSTESE